MSEPYYGRARDVELVIHEDGSAHITLGTAGEYRSATSLELTAEQVYVLSRLMRMIR